MPRMYVQYYLCLIQQHEESILDLCNRQVSGDGAKQISQEIRKLNKKIEEIRTEIQRILDPFGVNIIVEQVSENDRMRKAFARFGTIAKNAEKQKQQEESQDNPETKKPKRASNRPKKLK